MSIEVIEQKLSVIENVSNYTEKDILAEIYEDVALLKTLGVIDIDKNKYQAKLMSAKKKLGNCRREGNQYSKNFTISINKNYLQTAQAKDVHTTIMHEVLHSIPGCMNHKTRWKTMGSIVNAYYDFNPITTTTYSKEYHEKYLDNNYKYEITCDYCNNTWYRLKYTRVLKDCAQGKRICAKCGQKTTFSIIQLR